MSTGHLHLNGFESSFSFGVDNIGLDEIKVLPPGRRQAALIRAAFKWVRLPYREKKKKLPSGQLFLFAKERLKVV